MSFADAYLAIIPFVVALLVLIMVLPERAYPPQPAPAPPPESSPAKSAQPPAAQTQAPAAS